MKFGISVYTKSRFLSVSVEYSHYITWTISGLYHITVRVGILEEEKEAEKEND
jgi:hypothetical protein